MSAQRMPVLTPEEYLEMERAAESKSEYCDGAVFATAGASSRHAAITANVTAAFVVRLRGRPCTTCTSDLRLRVSPTGLYTYPDVIVVCGKPQFEDRRQDTLLNPSVIVEVLSPSTEGYDRGAKFRQYRTLESLTDYLLISQERALVEHYVRQLHEEATAGQSLDRWLLTAYQGLGNVVAIPSLEVELPLSEIYDKVDWAEEEGEARTLRVVREQRDSYQAEPR